MGKKKEEKKGKINGKARQQTKKKRGRDPVKRKPAWKRFNCDPTWPSKQDVAKKRQTENNKHKQTSQGKIQDPTNWLLLAWPYSNHPYYLSHPQNFSQAVCGHQHFALIFWSDRFAYCSKTGHGSDLFFFPASQSRMWVVAPQKKCEVVHRLFAAKYILSSFLLCRWFGLTSFLECHSPASMSWHWQLYTTMTTVKGMTRAQRQHAGAVGKKWACRTRHRDWTQFPARSQRESWTFQKRGKNKARHKHSRRSQAKNTGLQRAHQHYTADYKDRVVTEKKRE